jgi:hypothetical protein
MEGRSRGRGESRSQQEERNNEKDYRLIHKLLPSGYVKEVVENDQAKRFKHYTKKTVLQGWA